MNSNFSIGLIQCAIDIWNGKLKDILSLLSTDPKVFKGGSTYLLMTKVNQVMKGTGYALLVLFFVYGLVRKGTDIKELRRPEAVAGVLLRFILSKSLITYGMDILEILMKIAQGIGEGVTGSFENLGKFSIPDAVLGAYNNIPILEGIPLFIASIIGCVIILVLSYYLLFTVYGRFFKIYLLTAVSPLPMSTLCTEEYSRIGKSYLRSYVSALLEGIIVTLCCLIYSSLAISVPEISEDASVSSKIWLFLGELIFNMLILVGTVKISDRLVKEIIG